MKIPPQGPAQAVAVLTAAQLPDEQAVEDLMRGLQHEELLEVCASLAGITLGLCVQLGRRQGLAQDAAISWWLQRLGLMAADMDGE